MPRRPICPRCLHHIPNDLRPGAHHGALSRVASVEVCSACGCHEAMLSLAGGELPTVAEWPIAAPWNVTTPLAGVPVMP